MGKLLRLILTTLIYTSLLCFSVSAQEYQDFLDSLMDLLPGLEDPQNTGLTTLPILEISPGGERSNLGNAYTAVARDVSFFESNPAASSLLERTELAFFHRNLISDVSMDSVMYSQRKNNFGYGFAGKFLHFEFTSLDSRGNQLASAYPSELLFSANASYNFFDNYYFSGLAAGINLKIAHRNVPNRLFDRDFIDLAPGSQNLFAFMVDIGLLSRFNFGKFFSGREKNFSIGLSAKNLGPPVKGDPLPSEASIGLSYRPLRFLMLTSDISYLGNFVDFGNSEGIGFAAGLDLRFVEFFSIQAGLELRGFNPRFSVGADIDLRPVSFVVNYTLDLTTASNALDNFSITAKLDFGDDGRAALQRQVDELYIEALIALSNGEYQRVIELCEQIIDPENGIDPSFTPARETRDLAQTTLLREAQFTEFEQNRPAVSPEAETP